MAKYLSFLLLFILLSGCSQKEKVVEVIDGDTFKTANGERVRLLGINTPELSEPGGDIAKDYATLLLLNKNVELKGDVTDKDDYGRLLRYVYCEGRFINGELVRLGYAETRCYPPDTFYCAKLKELEKNAIRNHRGLWAFRVFQLPDTLPGSGHKRTNFGKKAISWRDAGKYCGQIKTVVGRIVASNNTGRVCFLNFHRNWKKYFTAVIFSSDYDKFPPNPEDHYLNHRVRVTGLIKEYKGKPEVILKSPSQIEIID